MKRKKTTSHIKFARLITWLIAVTVLVSTAFVMAETGPKATPSADSNLPLATFSGIKFPDQTEQVSAYPQFVGVTKNGYNGALQPLQATGYNVAKMLCNADYPGSHVCSANEIINSYEYSPQKMLNLNSFAWINNGPPGYDTVAANDCIGWTSSDPEYYGSFWDFESRSSFVTICKSQLPMACCK